MSAILDRLYDARNAVRWVRERLTLLQYPSGPRQDLRLALKLIERAEKAIREEQAKIEAQVRAL